MSGAAQQSSQSPNQRLQSAVKAFREGDSAPLSKFIHDLSVSPDCSAESLLDLGDALLQGGVTSFASECYRQALIRIPGLFRAWVHRGLVLSYLGKFSSAADHFSRALCIQKDLAVVHCNLAAALTELEATASATKASRNAAILDMQFPDAYYNLGMALEATAHPYRAIENYARAHRLAPFHVRSRNNLGKLAQQVDDFDLAFRQLRMALCIDPGLPEGLLNLAGTLSETRQFDGAICFYTRAISVKEDLVSAYMGRAMTHLLIGNYRPGFEDYEWRLKDTRQHYGHRTEPPPHYQGEDLSGKTVHVYWEQGLGDTLQFCRYARILAERGAHVLLNVQPALIALLSESIPRVEVISEDPLQRHADYQVPLLSLPLFLGLWPELLPAMPPYLHASQSRQVFWEGRLGSNAGRLKVGICWSGSRGHKNDHRRSIPLSMLSELCAVEMDFHCLQKEVRAEELELAQSLPNLHLHDANLIDFTDTAGLIAQMDLVISVDTSIAHLAGALGIRLWVLLPFTPDFRWLLERSDSPWYPSATLYRQSRRGDWASALRQVRLNLESLFAPIEKAGQSI